MNTSTIRALGLTATGAYAVFVIWVFASQPRSVAEVTGGVAAGLGVYHVDEPSFREGLEYFRRDQFAEARAAFDRADTAQRDATTQFYVAYSYYRQGWGRLYNDDDLFRRGIAAADRAMAVAPDGRLRVADPDLKLQSADELKAELERGLTRELSDLNPFRVLEDRK